MTSSVGPSQGPLSQEDAARWRAIVESAVDGIIVIDQHGRIESFNPAAERMFGYSVDEVIGRNVSILMPSSVGAEHDAHLQKYLTTGVPHVIGIGRDVEARRRDGSVFPAHLAVGEIVNEGERKFTGILRDLTERVNLERRLREEAGLARVGELAAVLAHEVKNPLAAVSGTLQVLSGKLASPEDREIVGEALRRLDALSAMMTDLLLYARPPKPHVMLLDITALAENLVGFVRMDPAWSAVECRVEGSSPGVMGDAEMLKLALQNLLLNALQAIGGRGSVSVRLSEEDTNVNIDVVDTGSGISPDVQSRLFTPFFTTKARGTGLGLATVRRIAKAHRGDVVVLATGSTGTTMRLSLPVQQHPAPTGGRT